MKTVFNTQIFWKDFYSRDSLYYTLRTMPQNNNFYTTLIEYFFLLLLPVVLLLTRRQIVTLRYCIFIYWHVIIAGTEI